MKKIFYSLLALLALGLGSCQRESGLTNVQTSETTTSSLKRCSTRVTLWFARHPPVMVEVIRLSPVAAVMAMTQILTQTLILLQQILLALQKQRLLVLNHRQSVSTLV